MLISHSQACIYRERIIFSLSQEEEVTLCIEPEPMTLIPSPAAQKEEVTSLGGSSPGQVPGESITEWKASDVTLSVNEMLEEKEGESESSSASAMVTK